MATSKGPNAASARPPLVVLLLVILGTTMAAAIPEVEMDRKLQRIQQLERDYVDLFEETEDKDALEAIKALHMQLDDDKDGAIEPSETGNFITEDLLIHEDSSKKSRRTKLHLTDLEITVRDLWQEWRRSEVYNWTVEQVIDWLVRNVELSQYADAFRTAKINGTQLPRLTLTTTPFLAKTLGILNPIHRSKVSLKAMDVVLFGPPREGSNVVKDLVLTSLLVLAVMGLFYAYRLNRKHEAHLQKMMRDMEGLAQAEQMLQELQDKLQQKESSMESPPASPSSNKFLDAMEVSRLREELEALRSELHRAEIELEDRCWMASPVLQHWLQLTYELESLAYNAKRRAAEEQLELAKEMCERLKRKRSSLVGAFVSTHGRSIDEVDRSILEAKSALMEVTKDLTERTHRWRQIEMLCGVPIVANVGLHVLQSLTCHVGGRGPRPDGPLARVRAAQAEEQQRSDDLEAMSNASSSFRSVQLRRRVAGASEGAKLRREPSKDSSADGYGGDEQVSLTSDPASPALGAKTASLSSKRARMVKSYSQDAGGSIQWLAGSAAIGCASGSLASVTSAMTTSVSEGQLLKKKAAPLDRAASIESNISSLNLSRPSVMDGSCSDSGSLNDMEGNNKKKKLPFFAFKRKKEKKEI